ncbi:MAG: S-adenosylmethionine:tRNA ribosyltransferase-isomerase [Bacteroidales bacterium]
MSEFHPSSVYIDEYNYILPENRIARFPQEDPAASKLLVYNKGRISHNHFGQLTDILEDNDFLVFNNTRVVQARIMMQKTTGAEIEIFLLEPSIPSEYNLAFTATSSCRWKCMTGNKKKWKKGELKRKFNIERKTVVFSAKIVKDHGEWQEIFFSWEPGDIHFSRIIENVGLTPIPPYLNRTAEAVDKERYQTVYSRFEGSVAAPTAGLHFTTELLDDIKNRGILTGEITLHVGAGTFQPVKAQTIDQHQMHTEHFSVNIETLEKIKKQSGNITAVGTTSARTLETIYWLGVKQLHLRGESLSSTFLSQWEANELPGKIPVSLAIDTLIKMLERENKGHIDAKTQLMIIPGYEFKVVNKLITNFHQPRSTLLLLISAFIGKDWLKVYRYAMENNFRFLSYGDSSLLIP